MGLVQSILDAVEILVNNIFAAVIVFLGALGIDVDLPDIDLK